MAGLPTVTRMRTGEELVSMNTSMLNEGLEGLRVVSLAFTLSQTVGMDREQR